MTERWCFLRGLLLYICFTAGNGIGHCASSYYANAPLLSDANTIRFSRKGLWPAVSLSGTNPTGHISAPQTFNPAVTYVEDKNTYTPTAITKAITQTYPIAINKIAGEYVYPYKQIFKNAPIHACLAGYDGEIFKIIDDIKQTSGSEIEVHFYLFYKCKFNVLGSHVTTVKNIQDVLAKYHHYICLNKKYVETSYNAKEHCWYIEKLIVIPSFHNDVEFLHKNLQVQDFSKMCCSNGEPLVIEVEEKYNNLVKQEQDNTICLKDIGKISQTDNVGSNLATNSIALKYNTRFNNEKNIFKTNSVCNPKTFIQQVAPKYSTPTVLISNYGPNADKQGYANEIGTPCTQIWYNNIPTSTNASFRTGQSNVCNNYICQNAQNALNSYLSGSNLVTPAPVCKIISRNNQVEKNDNTLPLKDNLKGNFINIVDNVKKVSSDSFKFLPVNSQGRLSVVPLSKSTQNVNQNRHNHQYQTTQQNYYTKNRNLQSYWSHNNLYQQIGNSMVEAPTHRHHSYPIYYGQNNSSMATNSGYLKTIPIVSANDKTNRNLLLEHIINYSSNKNPSRNVVLQQNVINSGTANNVIVPRSLQATVLTNRQQTRGTTHILPNYSFHSNAIKGMDMMRDQTKILVYNPTQNIWKNVLQTKIIPSTSITSIPAYSKVALSPQPTFESDQYLNQFVPYLQPLNNVKVQAILPSQIISSYTPSQFKPQQNPIVPCVQTPQTLRVEPLTDQQLKTVQPLEIVSYQKPRQHPSYVQASNIVSFDQTHRSTFSKRQFAPYIRPPEKHTSYTPLQSAFPSFKIQTSPQIISYSSPKFVTNNMTSQGQKYHQFTAYQSPKITGVPISNVVDPAKTIKSLPALSLKYVRPRFLSMSPSQNIMIQASKQPSSLIYDQKSNLLPNIERTVQYSHGIPQSAVNYPQCFTQIKDTPLNNRGFKNKNSSYQTTTSDSPVNANFITSNANHNQVPIIRKVPFAVHGVGPLNPAVSEAVLKNKLTADTYYDLKPTYQTKILSPAAKTNPTLITSYTVPDSLPVQYSEVLVPSNLNPCPPQEAKRQDTVTNTEVGTKIYTNQIGDSNYGTLKSINPKRINDNLNIISEFTPKTEQTVLVNQLNEQVNKGLRPPVQFDTLPIQPEKISVTPMTIVPYSTCKETPSTSGTLLQSMFPNIGLNNYIRQQGTVPLLYTPTIIQKKASPNMILPYSYANKIGQGYNVWFIPSQKVSNSAVNPAINILSPYNPSQLRVSLNLYTSRLKPIGIIQTPNILYYLRPIYNFKNNIARPSDAMNIKFSPCASNIHYQNSVNTFNPIVCGKAMPIKESVKVQPITYQALDKQNIFIPSNYIKQEEVNDKPHFYTPSNNELPIAYKAAKTYTQKLLPYKLNTENVDVINSYTNGPVEVPYANPYKTAGYPMSNIAAKMPTKAPLTNTYETILYTKPTVGTQWPNEIPQTNVYKIANYQHPKEKIPKDIPMNPNGNYVLINSYDSAKRTTGILNLVKPIQPQHVSVNIGPSYSIADVQNTSKNIDPNYVNVFNSVINGKFKPNVVEQQKINQFVNTVTIPQIHTNKRIFAFVKPVQGANKDESAREENSVKIDNYTPYINKVSTAYTIPSWAPITNKPMISYYSQQRDSSQPKFVQPIVSNIPNYQQTCSNPTPDVRMIQLNKPDHLYMPKNKHENYQTIDSYSNPQPLKYANIHLKQPGLKIIPYTSQLPTKVNEYKTYFKSLAKVFNPNQYINIPSYSQPCIGPTKVYSKIIPRKQSIVNIKLGKEGQDVDIQFDTESPDTITYSSTTPCIKSDAQVSGVIPTYTTNPQIFGRHRIPWNDDYIKIWPRAQICDKFSTVSRTPNILSNYQTYIPDKISGTNEIPVEISSYKNPFQKLSIKRPTQSTNTKICYEPCKNFVTTVYNTTFNKQPYSMFANLGPYIQEYKKPINVDNVDKILAYSPKYQQRVDDPTNKLIIQPKTSIVESYIQPKKDEENGDIKVYTDVVKQEPDNMFIRIINRPTKQFSSYADPVRKEFVTIDANTKTQIYNPTISYYYEPGKSIFNQKKSNNYTAVQYLNKENNVKPESQYCPYVKPNLRIEKYTTNNIIPTLNTPQSYDFVSFKPQSICGQKLSPPTVKIDSYSKVPSSPYITSNENTPKPLNIELNPTKSAPVSIFAAPDIITSYTEHPQININKYSERNPCIEYPNKYNIKPNKVYEKGPCTETVNMPAKTAEKYVHITTYSPNNNNIQPLHETIPTYTKPSAPIMEHIQKYQTNAQNIYNVISTYTTVKETLPIQSISYKPKDFMTAFNQIKTNTATSLIKKPICQQISYATPMKTPAKTNTVQYIDWYQNSQSKNSIMYTPSVNSIKASRNKQLVQNIEQFQKIPSYVKDKLAHVGNVQVLAYRNQKQNNAASYVIPYYTNTIIPCNVKTSIPCFTRAVTPRPLTTTIFRYTKKNERTQIIPCDSQQKSQYVPYYTANNKGNAQERPPCIPQTVISNASGRYNPQIVPWSSQQRPQIIPNYTVEQKQPTIVRTPLAPQMVTTNIVYNRPQTVNQFGQNSGHYTATQKSPDLHTTNIMYENLPQITPITTLEKVQTVPRYTAAQKDVSNKPCMPTNVLYQRPQKKYSNTQRRMQVVPCYTNTQRKVVDIPHDISQFKPANVLNKHFQTIPYTLERTINVPYYTTVPNALYRPVNTLTNVLYNQNQRDSSICTTPIYNLPTITQDVVCQAPSNTSSYFEVQKFVWCIQNYIQQYIIRNPQFKEALKNLSDDPNIKTYLLGRNVIPLTSISLLNCNFGDRQDYTVTNISNAIEIRKFVKKVKIIKPKLFFETEEVEVPNFVPVVKGHRQGINNEQVQNYVRNKLSGKYSVVVVNKPCPKTGQCVVNWDTRQGGRKAVIWPSRFENKK